MAVIVAILVLNNIINHQIHRSNLIVFKCCVDGRAALLVLVEYWEFWVEILLVLVIQK